MNNPKLRNIFTEQYYIGTIIEVNLNIAKINLHSNIKNKYNINNQDISPAGKVNQYVIIDCNDSAILCNIIKMEIDRNENDNLENKINKNISKQINATAIISYLGEYNLTNKQDFTQGIKHYPSISNRVYVATQDWIERCFKQTSQVDSGAINLGKIHNFEELDISIKKEDLFTHHMAIVGSTGSGKSTTLRRLIEEFINKSKNTKDKLILIDPSGEYETIVNSNNNDVEYSKDTWHIDKENITTEDWFALLRPSPGAQAPCLEQALQSYNKDNILSDKIKDLTSELNFGNLPPNRYRYSDIVTLIHRVKNMEQNPNMSWLFQQPPDNKTKESKDIITEIKKFLDEGDKTLYILDCSRLTSDNHSKEFFVNLLCRYLLKKKKEDYKSGSEKELTPLVLCIDEAHNFLNKFIHGETPYNLNAASLIAKEGRKYGLHICLATQRTRDLPEDILSQIGFIISHRLSNDEDINLAKKSLYNTNESILKALPSLPTGSAFIFSSNFKLPLQIQITQPESQSKSNNIKFNM
jgi:ABC-type dipeptide/oligopeptide/nickel transport system ATPase component